MRAFPPLCCDGAAACRLPQHVAWGVMLAAAIGQSLLAAEPGIFVIDVATGQERCVVAVDQATSHLSPRWSHDGRQLVFEVADAGGDAKIFVVDIDGTGLKEVSPHGSPDWSPDDKQLVYHQDPFEPEPSIWVENVDGQGRQQLARGSWPRWSPDGGQIAYCDGTSLMLIDLATSEQRAVVEGQFSQRPGSFDWSHDGKRLALFTRRVAGGPRELFIISATGQPGGLQPRYARPGRVGGHVTWSPDDKRLAFTVDSYIHTLRVDGQADPELLPGQQDKSRDPAWSPDGKWIVFARRDDP